MKREIITIDEDKCTGCGLCIPNCHEGALQMIDGKARLISDLMCDGLGACIGHCPEGAITIEKREAAPYNETLVIKEMVLKGKNTVIAHLQHLKDHQQDEFIQDGISWMEANRDQLSFDLDEAKLAVFGAAKQEIPVRESGCGGGGCPGSQTVAFQLPSDADPQEEAAGTIQSELRQWPVQMHLVNPTAPYFQGADLVLAADCVAFSLGDFHRKYLKGKALGIACPKLDHGKDVYVEKLRSMIDEAQLNTITVMMMEVPCCGGLVQLVQIAQQHASRKIPVKAITVSIRGEVLSENWI